MDLAAVRAGLAANLLAIPGVQASAYMLSDPTLPCAYVQPAGVDYVFAMQAGSVELDMTVIVLAGLTTDIGAQKLLDEFITYPGARSVKAALEADKTLGGAAEDVIVREVGEYRAIARENGGPALAAEWTVRVIAPGAP